MNLERARVTAEVYFLRVRYYVWLVVQLTGFAVLLYGAYRLFTLQFHDVVFPDLWGVLGVPMVGYYESFALMAAGAIIVKLTTSTE